MLNKLDWNKMSLPTEHDLSGACGVYAYVKHYRWVSVRLDEG